MYISTTTHQCTAVTGERMQGSWSQSQCLHPSTRLGTGPTGNRLPLSCPALSNSAPSPAVTSRCLAAPAGLPYMPASPHGQTNQCSFPSKCCSTLLMGNLLETMSKSGHGAQTRDAGFGLHLLSLCVLSCDIGQHIAEAVPDWLVQPRRLIVGHSILNPLCLLQLCHCHLHVTVLYQLCSQGHLSRLHHQGK